MRTLNVTRDEYRKIYELALLPDGTWEREACRILGLSLESVRGEKLRVVVRPEANFIPTAFYGIDRIESAKEASHD